MMKRRIIKRGTLQHAQQQFDNTVNLRFETQFVWLDDTGLHWGTKANNYEEEEGFIRMQDIARVESFGAVVGSDYTFKIHPKVAAEDKHVFGCASEEAVLQWIGHLTGKRQFQLPGFDADTAALAFNKEFRPLPSPTASTLAQTAQNAAPRTMNNYADITVIRKRIQDTAEQIEKIELLTKRLLVELAAKNVITLQMEDAANEVQAQYHAAFFELDEYQMLCSMFFYEPEQFIVQNNTNEVDIQLIQKFVQTQRSILNASQTEMENTMEHTALTMREAAYKERQRQLQMVKVKDLKQEIAVKREEIDEDIRSELNDMKQNLNQMHEEFLVGDTKAPMLREGIKENTKLVVAAKQDVDETTEVLKNGLAKDKKFFWYREWYGLVAAVGFFFFGISVFFACLIWI